jgi:hypothetical protein
VKRVNPHTELIRAVEKLAMLTPHIFIWVNNTGAGMLDGKRFVKFGLKGSSYFIGMSSDGKILCLECKTGDARQTFDQRIFQERVQKLGGRYYVIRSVTDAVQVFHSLRPAA